MVGVVASNAVGPGFESQSSPIKTNFRCFCAKQTAFIDKSKDWLARNQRKLFKWSDMSTRGLLFHCEIPTQRDGLEQR